MVGMELKLRKVARNIAPGSITLHHGLGDVGQELGALSAETAADHIVLAAVGGFLKPFHAV